MGGVAVWSEWIGGRGNSYVGSVGEAIVVLRGGGGIALWVTGLVDMWVGCRG